jgi:hypothetical protein
MFRADDGDGADLLEAAQHADGDVRATRPVAEVLGQDFFLAVCGRDRDEGHGVLPPGRLIPE